MSRNPKVGEDIIVIEPDGTERAGKVVKPVSDVVAEVFVFPTAAESAECNWGDTTELYRDEPGSTSRRWKFRDE